MDIVLIVAAFILYFLYDKNQIQLHQKWLQPSFFLGSFLLAGGIIYAYIQSWHQNVNYVFVVIAIVFFIALVYVLFFALPFSDTYVEENIHKVCQTGCYALCRHPGFWLLAGMMISLSLSVMTWHMWIVALIVNIGNFIYICYQDKVSFPCQFEDYNEYKKEVPFLLFTYQSIRKCIDTWR